MSPSKRMLLPSQPVIEPLALPPTQATTQQATSPTLATGPESLERTNEAPAAPMPLIEPFPTSTAAITHSLIAQHNAETANSASADEPSSPPSSQSAHDEDHDFSLKQNQLEANLARGRPLSATQIQELRTGGAGAGVKRARSTSVSTTASRSVKQKTNAATEAEAEQQSEQQTQQQPIEATQDLTQPSPAGSQASVAPSASQPVETTATATATAVAENNDNNANESQSQSNIKKQPKSRRKSSNTQQQQAQQQTEVRKLPPRKLRNKRLMANDTLIEQELALRECKREMNRKLKQAKAQEELANRLKSISQSNSNKTPSKSADNRLKPESAKHLVRRNSPSSGRSRSDSDIVQEALSLNTQSASTKSATKRSKFMSPPDTVLSPTQQMRQIFAQCSSFDEITAIMSSAAGMAKERIAALQSAQHDEQLQEDDEMVHEQQQLSEIQPEHQDESQPQPHESDVNTSIASRNESVACNDSTEMQQDEPNSNTTARRSNSSGLPPLPSTFISEFSANELQPLPSVSAATAESQITSTSASSSGPQSPSHKPVNAPNVDETGSGATSESADDDEEMKSPPRRNASSASKKTEKQQQNQRLSLSPHARAEQLSKLIPVSSLSDDESGEDIENASSKRQSSTAIAVGVRREKAPRIFSPIQNESSGGSTRALTPSKLAQTLAAQAKRKYVLEQTIEAAQIVKEFEREAAARSKAAKPAKPAKPAAPAEAAEPTKTAEPVEPVEPVKEASAPSASVPSEAPGPAAVAV